MAPQRVQHHTAGFTLIELLVVSSIISLLVAMLLPSLSRSRLLVQQVTCRSNLKQIYLGSVAYANDYRQRFPDKNTLGGWILRRAPGETNPADPWSLPERFGLAATLDKLDYMPGRSRVWVCPGQNEASQDWGNTYAFSIANNVLTDPYHELASKPLSLWVWDNYSAKPGLTGFMGPFMGYVIPTDERYYPHADIAPFTPENAYQLYKGTNALFFDGHADYRMTRTP